MLRLAQRYGTTQSGLTMQEITYLQNANVAEFGNISLDDPRKQGYFMRALNFYLRNVMGASRLRENSTRYAALLYFHNEIVGKGKSIEEVGYTATNPDLLQGITSKEEQAVRLANNLMGDYGAISHYGRYLRRTIFPFWSFPETNFTRYYWIFRNAPRDARNRGKSVILASALIFKFYLFQQIANNFLFGDEEDELTTQERVRPHINLGTWFGEKVKIDLQGSLFEALKWIGLGPDNIAKAIGEYQGRDNLELVWDVMLAPLYAFLGGINPLAKMPLELVAGYASWPDPHEPRYIKDRMEFATRLFGLEHEYRELAKLANQPVPSRGYAKAWLHSILTSRPVGEQAYYYIRSTGYNYMKEVMGKPTPTGASNPLYYGAKQAMKWGDKKAYGIAIKKLEQGDGPGTIAGLAQSVRSANVFAMLPLTERQKFKFHVLTEFEREHILPLAEEWYRFTLLEKGLVR